VTGRLTDDQLEELAADLCDRARRPARSVYHPESWEHAKRVLDRMRELERELAEYKADPCRPDLDCAVRLEDNEEK